MARQLLRLAQSETESTAQRHAHLVSALHVLTSLPAVAQYGGEQLARDVVLELTLTSGLGVQRPPMPPSPTSRKLPAHQD
jgi:hypothetical protein